MKVGAGRFAELAKSEELHRSYYSRVLRLAWLAPDITEAILDGWQPAGLTASTLTDGKDLPLDWAKQRQALGFT